MKVYIHFKNKNNQQAFEGVRMRKTLKGECESVGIAWVDSQWQSPNLATFISYSDINKLNDCKLDGVKTVVCCFYSERDEKASFLKKKGGVYQLDKKKTKFLNASDLVLVPNEILKEFALTHGVKTRVEVLPFCLTQSKFDKRNNDKEIFPRYFSIRENEKVAICTGSFKDKEKLSSLYRIASSCPSYRFFFFGTDMGKWLSYSKIKGVSKPKNVSLESLVADDIYRSALLRASIYLVLDDIPDVIGVMDAFSASCQVVCLGKQPLNDLLIDQKTCYMFEKEEKISNFLELMYQEKTNNTIIQSLSLARKYSLAKGGEILKGYYLSLLEKEKENA